MWSNVGGRKFTAFIIVVAVYVFFGIRSMNFAIESFPYLIFLCVAFFTANAGKDLIMEKLKNGKAETYRPDRVGNPDRISPPDGVGEGE